MKSCSSWKPFMNLSRCSSPCPPHLSPNHLQHRGLYCGPPRLSSSSLEWCYSSIHLRIFAHAQAWPVHVTAHSQTDSLYDKQVNAGIQSIVWSSLVSGPIISFSKSQKSHTPIDRFFSYGSYSLDLSTSLSEIYKIIEPDSYLTRKPNLMRIGKELS